MVLTEKQNEVFDKIKIFIDSDTPVFILRGYAGTGKYTINMEIYFISCAKWQSATARSIKR